jgi:membrane protease YdiL (CAAX protease family)
VTKTGGDTARIRQRARRIFVGTDGLRAGWSLALYFLLMAIAILLIAVLVPPDNDPNGVLTARGVFLGAVPQAVALCVLALVMARIERRPLARYGLRRAHAVPDFAIGLGVGLAAISLLVAALWLAGGLVFHGVALGGFAALAASSAWIGAMLLVAFVEEFWFRGYLQFTLARGVAGAIRARWPGLQAAGTIGFWSAAAIFSGLFFVLAHSTIGGETVLGIASVAMAGFVFVFGLYRSGALWWSIGFHAAWDWGETCLYGVSDSGSRAQGYLLSLQPHGPAWLSGGSAGPEGSLLVFPALLLAAACIQLLFHRRTPIAQTL